MDPSILRHAIRISADIMQEVKVALENQKSAFLTIITQDSVLTTYIHIQESPPHVVNALQKLGRTTLGV